MTNAHITSQADNIHALLSTGELFIGTIDEITTLLRSRYITVDDITMPDKDREDAPSTGQRIAIYHALHDHEPFEIDQVRKRPPEIDLPAGADGHGHVHDAWTIEQRRRAAEDDIG